MLVLSRHENESVILLNGLIKVTVTQILGDRVKIGFEAGPEIRIDREEIHQQRERDSL